MKCLNGQETIFKKFHYPHSSVHHRPKIEDFKNHLMHNYPFALTPLKKSIQYRYIKISLDIFHHK